MAPRKGDSSDLQRFLLASKEWVVKNWLARLLSTPALGKKLRGRASPEHLFEILSGIYDSLINPLSFPTRTGKTRKVRLKKSPGEFLKPFSLHEVQQAQLILLDLLKAAARRQFSGKPRKIEAMTARLDERVHSLLLQSSTADTRRHERATARAEGKYARLLGMASDAIFLPDYNTGLFVEVNKAACELTGYTENELKQMGFNSLVSVFDLNLAIEKANTAMEKGAVRFDDLSIYTKKGVEVPVDISASVITIDGKRHILTIVRDIKERKAFEKKLKEEARRLKLVNEIGQAISSVDLDIEAVLATILEAVARAIKVEAGSVLILEDGDLLFMAALGEKAEYVKPFRLKVGQGIAGWVAKTGEELIVRDVHKDPRYYPEVEKATGFVSKSILAVPMKIGDKVVGVIELINKIGGRFTKKDLGLISAIASFSAVALDHARLFSERELAETRFSEAHSPLSSSELAAAVAHEMKDPLGILKNYVRILRDKLSSDGIEHEELAVLSDEADRIAQIADQLLHFSEASSEHLRETPLNLLIENSIESMGKNLERAGIATELRLESSLPQIPVIPNQLAMVFSNLIRLAMADMPGGGTLTVATRKSDSYICVEFSNTGIKHTGKKARELFLPSAVAKGLVPKGIGLYMADSIIRGYGGDIEVRSHRGRGNIFRMRIPIKPGSRSGGVSR